jgi:2-polyprenyl-3-methyl-5-hydroxy-6-metoxy-1,4-benzoquinol methylase
MKQNDLASPEHWTKRYEMEQEIIKPGWTPHDYNSLVLEHALLKGISKCNPQRILEIGCGGSTWLPYLAKKTNAIVAGIDYSETGCKLAKMRLEVEEVKGEIYCIDVFKADPTQVGLYDFVFSLGVVEHFQDLDNILATMTRFVRPGGILFTEVPNLRSFHGLLKWVWQPKCLSKHRLLTKTQLERAYKKAGFTEIESKYCGLFSLNMVAWGIEPRWPRIEKATLPYIRRCIRLSDVILRKLKGFDKSIPFFSPFIYVFGGKALSPLDGHYSRPFYT